MKLYNPKLEKINIFSTFLLIPLSGLVTDVYLPSFPDMQSAFNVSEVAIQQTLSYFLISYGIAMLFTGIILDSFGRYNLVLISLGIFALSNLMLPFVSSIYAVYFIRIIQGIVCSIIVVGKRAFLADIFSGSKLKHYTSLLTIIWAFAPILAPFIGGYLQHNFGWKSNFYMLSIYGAVAFFLELIFCGESLKEFKEFRLRPILSAYSHILKAPDFSFGLLLLGCIYGMMMGFNMAAPFIVEGHFNLTSVETGYTALASGLGLMMGGIVAKNFLKSSFYGSLYGGLLYILLLGVLMYVFGHWFDNLYLLIAFVFLIQTGGGFIYNIYFTYCLTRFPQYAGMSNGLSSGGSFLMTSLVSYLIINNIKINDQSSLSLNYILAVLGALIFLSLGYFLSKKTILK